MSSDKKLLKNKPHLGPYELMIQLLACALLAIALGSVVVRQMPGVSLWADLYPYDILLAFYVVFFVAAQHLAKLYVARLNRPLISIQDHQDNFRALPFGTKLLIGIFGWGAPCGLIMGTGDVFYTGFDFQAFVTQLLTWMAMGVAFIVMFIVMDFFIRLAKTHILRKP